MPDPLMPRAAVPRTSRAETLLIVVGVVLVIFVGAVFYITEYINSEQTISPTITDTGGEAKLGGTLFWSIDSQSAPGNLRGSYFYNLVTKARGVVIFTDSLSAFRVVKANDASRYAGLMRDSAGTLSIRVVEEIPGDEVWSHALPKGLVGNIAIDSTGRWIAYSYVPEDIPESLRTNPVVWLTVLLDTQNSGEPRYFNGMSPVFVKDTLLLLDNTGIQAINSNNGALLSRFDLVTSEKQTLTAFSNLSASDNGRVAVVVAVNDDTDEVRVLSFSNAGDWNDLRRFTLNARTATLSPNGHFVALHIINEANVTLPGSGKVDIYSVEHGSVERTLDLSVQSPSIFMSEWSSMSF